MHESETMELKPLMGREHYFQLSCLLSSPNINKIASKSDINVRHDFLAGELGGGACVMWGKMLTQADRKKIAAFQEGWAFSGGARSGAGGCNFPEIIYSHSVQSLKSLR